MNLNLEKKRVIVSGSTKGIGHKIAESFLEEGAKVAILARTKERLEEVRLDLSRRFSLSNIMTFETDVTDSKSVNSTISQIARNWGGIDIVVANVGDGRSVADPMPDQLDFDKTWRTNFSSAENLARETIEELDKSKGNLIFISSIAGLESIGAPTDYSIAKSAIIALSKNLARKLAPNVRVNCIAPGNIFFPGGSWDDKIQKDLNRIQNLIETTVPMKRFGKPEEIANTVLFLASDRASFITGACLVVDGGQTVGFH